MWEVLRKRAEWYYGPTVPQDAELWELGWRGQGAIVTYLKCPRYDKGGYYIEDDQGQRVLPCREWEKMSWCGWKEKKEESSVPTERKSAARVEKVVRPREAKVQQSGDGDQREFDLETKVITNGNLIIPEMFHSCALNK